MVATVVLAAPVLTQRAMALTDEQEEMFAQNDILFYDPDDNCYYGAGHGGASDELPGAVGSGYERLKNAVKTYGEFAMEMQRVYGVPWEVVFAQMQQESSMGQAGHAVNGATNNWLGITGEGDAGYYVSPPSENYPSGRKWAKYTSIEASIEAWAGVRVLRNGIYDDAFAYLDPAKYDLDGFLTAMLAHYAPSSDGNDESAYALSVKGFIAGPIAEVREEMGWPSSAELAKSENIAIGGEHPLTGGPIGENPPEGTGAGIMCQSGGLVEGGITEIGPALGVLAEFIEAERAESGLAMPDLPRSASFNQALGTPGRDDVACWGLQCGQCTTISKWFTLFKTNYTYTRGNGGQVAMNLVSANSGLGFGSAPQPYSVFSWYYAGDTTFGHTGVVLGVLPDESIVTIENNDAAPHQVGVMLRTKEFYTSKAAIFAYVGDNLK